MTRRFTGKHMTLILVAFFAVVITVNFTMAWLASSTFGGLVVDNSYVASQKFNGWLEKARTEQALGWTMTVERAADNHIIVTLADAKGPMTDAVVTGRVRHPLGRETERDFSFHSAGGGTGRYASIEALPAGRWIAHVQVSARGSHMNRVADLP